MITTKEEYFAASRKEQVEYNRALIADERLQTGDNGGITNLEYSLEDCNGYRSTNNMSTYSPEFFYRIKEPTLEEQFKAYCEKMGFEVGAEVIARSNNIRTIIGIYETILVTKANSDRKIIQEWDLGELQFFEFKLYEPTPEERCQKFVKDNNLKVGDKVKITVSVKDVEWDRNKDQTIGMIGKVTFIKTNRIEVYFDCIDDWWMYNVESLEKVEDEYRPFKSAESSIDNKIRA